VSTGKVGLIGPPRKGARAWRKSLHEGFMRGERSEKGRTQRKIRPWRHSGEGNKRGKSFIRAIYLVLSSSTHESTIAAKRGENHRGRPGASKDLACPGEKHALSLRTGKVWGPGTVKRNGGRPWSVKENGLNRPNERKRGQIEKK